MVEGMDQGARALPGVRHRVGDVTLLVLVQRLPRRGRSRGQAPVDQEAAEPRPAPVRTLLPAAIAASSRSCGPVRLRRRTDRAPCLSCSPGSPGAVGIALDPVGAAGQAEFAAGTGTGSPAVSEAMVSGSRSAAERFRLRRPSRRCVPGAVPTMLERLTQARFGQRLRHGSGSPGPRPAARRHRISVEACSPSCTAT